jgi:hypothetical protein
MVNKVSGCGRASKFAVTRPQKVTSLTNVTLLY